MWERFKAWLIKRLGGYTKEEYDDWSRIPIAKTLIVEQRFRSVDLRADRTVTFEQVSALGAHQAEIHAKTYIREALSGAMLPYIVWRMRRHPTGHEMIVEGVITVQERV